MILRGSLEDGKCTPSLCKVLEKVTSICTQTPPFVQSSNFSVVLVLPAFSLVLRSLTFLYTVTMNSQHGIDDGEHSLIEYVISLINNSSIIFKKQ